MKKIFLIISLATLISCASHSQNQQNFVNIESEGNLKSSHDLKCIKIEQAKPSFNPPALFNSVKDCIEKKENDNAAQLLTLAFAYGKYDSLRVEDKTAHQAIHAIKFKTFKASNQETLVEFNKFYKEHYKKGSENYSLTCELIITLGKPSYHPEYMINHGMNSFEKDTSSGIVENFDENTSWQNVLNSYIKCK